MNRRQLITGLASLVAAPAIVRAGSLMPVKQMIIAPQRATIPLTAIYDIWPRPEVYVGDLVRIDGKGWWVRDMMDYGRRLLLEEFI